MRMAEKSLLLQLLDQIWKDHLLIARPSAPGDQSARLRPARSVERIQARGLRAVRGHAGQSAPARDLGALAYRAARAAAGFCRCDGRARGGDGRGDARHRHHRAAGRSALPPAAAAGLGKRRRPRPGRAAAAGRFPRTLGRNTAQCPLSLRLGSEIQALPWPRLSGGAARQAQALCYRARPAAGA